MNGKRVCLACGMPARGVHRRTSRHRPNQESVAKARRAARPSACSIGRPKKINLRFSSSTRPTRLPFGRWSRSPRTGSRSGMTKRRSPSSRSPIRQKNSLVDQFDVARSPMPLTMVVAPNKAVTGVFSKELKDEHFDAAIVTPTMTRCMKSLQEGKLVFVCLQTTDKDAAPPVVKAMQLDPEFSSRVAVVSLDDWRPGREPVFLSRCRLTPDRSERRSPRCWRRPAS